jgi:hypothetical protein
MTQRSLIATVSSSMAPPGWRQHLCWNDCLRGHRTPRRWWSIWAVHRGTLAAVELRWTVATGLALVVCRACSVCGD